MTGQAHVHEPVSHERFNHALSGLLHLIALSRKKIDDLMQGIAHVDREIAAVVREFHKLAKIHDVEYQNIPGYESATFKIEEYAEKASHYFWGMVAGIIMAVVLGAYFSYNTMVAYSPVLLFLGSVLVALLVGEFASIILRAAFGADARRPHATRNVNISLVVAGVGFFGLFAAFGWLRFNSASPLAAYLPTIVVGLELSAIIFAGACDCGYRMHRWSEVLAKKHHALLNHKAELEDKLANEHVTLQELEYRLHLRQDKPLVAEHAEEHHEHHHEHATVS